MTTIRSLFDENCSARIVRGVRRRAPARSTLTAQEAGFRSSSDSALLEFAARDGRIVVSRDLRTMKAHAETRGHANEAMAGLILIRQNYPIGQAIDDLVLIAEVSTPDEWYGKIVFLPV